MRLVFLNDITIVDCRAKETMAISRPGDGGDFEIAFFIGVPPLTEYGRKGYRSWFQLKKPYKENYKEILVLFDLIKNRLVQRSPEC